MFDLFRLHCAILCRYAHALKKRFGVLEAKGSTCRWVRPRSTEHLNTFCQSSNALQICSWNETPDTRRIKTHQDVMCDNMFYDGRVPQNNERDHVFDSLTAIMFQWSHVGYLEGLELSWTSCLSNSWGNLLISDAVGTQADVRMM